AARGRAVDRVVDERHGEVHRHPILPALLPCLGDLGPTDLDSLEPVGPPGAAKLIALPLKATELLRGETILHGAQIAPGDAGLDVGEGALRPVGEPRRVEGRVHRTNVSDPAIEIRLARR